MLDVCTCKSWKKQSKLCTHIEPSVENQKELKSQIEMVQRRAARFVMSDYNQQSSVSLMLQKLQWQSLNERRAHSKTIMLYRIMNCLVAIPAAPPYVFLSSEGTRGHHLQLRQQHCRILTYQHSFFPSVVHLWNALPAEVVSASSIEAFKHHLSSVTLR